MKNSAPLKVGGESKLKLSKVDLVIYIITIVRGQTINTNFALCVIVGPGHCANKRCKTNMVQTRTCTYILCIHLLCHGVRHIDLQLSFAPNGTILK